MKSFKRWAVIDAPLCDGSKYFRSVAETKVDYDQFIDVLKQPANTRLLLCRGIIAQVEPMSSDQYLEQCSVCRGHNPPLPQNEHACVNPGKIDHYAQLMKNGDKFPLPMLNYVFGNQDGRHRALAALANGVKRIPVITFRYSDDDYLRNDYQYPENWYASKGLLLDKTTGAIVGDFRHCNDEDDVKAVFKRAHNAYTPLLTERWTDNTQTLFASFIREITPFNTNVFDRGSVADITIDNDAHYRLKVIESTGGRADVFVSYEDMHCQFFVDGYNLWQVTEMISTSQSYKHLLTRLYNHVNGIERQYGSIVANNDRFVTDTLINSIHSSLGFIKQVKVIGNTVVFEVGDDSVEKMIVFIDRSTNQVTFDYRATNLYIGTIDLSKQSIVKSYQQMVRQVNQLDIITPIIKFVEKYRA